MAKLEIDPEALEKGGKPIPIHPTKEFWITRLLVLPVISSNGSFEKGLYMRHPANIIVTAFSPGEASARADEIQVNTQDKAWKSYGSRPWDGRGNWFEEPLPPYTKALELR